MNLTSNHIRRMGGINRNIVECKSLAGIKRLWKAHELIETLWNVNVVVLVG